MTRTILLAALGAASLLFAPRPAGPQDREAVQPVTVLLVRHAEKEGDAKGRTVTIGTRKVDDPALTEAGRERAEALARLLSNAGVTHLFATELSRTQQTLAPLAQATSLTTKVIPAADDRAQVAALRALPPGAVAVVAGHSNTTPKLVKALGGAAKGLTRRAHIPDDAFDRLYVITLPAGAGAAARTLELRYGAPPKTQ